MSARVMSLAGKRRKRDPYTRFACTACKRRKIKCSGDTPCTVCHANGTECLYERCKRRRPSSSKRSDRPAEPPQELPNSLTGRASDNSSSNHSKANCKSTSKPSPAPLRPGSSNYFYTLAEELHTNASPPSNSASRNKTVPALAMDKVLRDTHEQKMRNPDDSVLSILSLQQCFDIIDLYEDEIGQLYPFLELEALRTTLARVYANRPNSSSIKHSPDQQVRNDTNVIFTLLVAIMAVLEDPDVDHIAEAFTAETRRALAFAAQVEGTREQDIQALILVVRYFHAHYSDITLDNYSLLYDILQSIYYFMTDREVLAWRNIGTVLRILQELGYHNSSSLQQRFELSSDRTRAQKILWSAYTLDRRWSSGTGLPFAILESDIDYAFDTPDDSISSVYLRSMVAYCQIASECRPSIVGDIRSDGHKWVDSEFSDFRIVEWRRRLPHSLQFDSRHQRFDPNLEDRSQYRMRLLLYLRANQMRMMIRRQSAARPSPTQTDASHMHSMVEVACDTIRILSDVTHTCDVYHTQQRTFNHFLETAISSLLMAVACRQDLKDSRCLSGLTMAMDMVKDLASKSSMMRKLRDKLQELKIVQVIMKHQSTIQPTEAVRIPGHPNNTTERILLGSNNVQLRSSTRRHSIHTTPTSRPGTSSLALFPWTAQEVPTPSSSGLQALNFGSDENPSPVSYSTAPSLLNDSTSWPLAASSLGVEGISPPLEPPTVDGVEIDDSALLDLQNFPYPYFSDLQGMLDVDVNTFTF